MNGKRGRIQSEKPMLFDRVNYRIMGVGVLLIITGFTAMYLENEVYGFISLYISPVVILSGYLTVLYSILRQPEADRSGTSGTSGGTSTGTSRSSSQTA